jgi:chromate transporter
MIFKVKSNIWEIAKLFTKLGFISFGGPAAHNAMMEDEVVTKRKWMSSQHFLDLIGVTNLIPGPNSTELAMLCGFHRAGFPGLLIAGAGFIFPAMLITLLFAYLYFEFGHLPTVEPFLYGIKPAVIAIILNAVYRLSRGAVKNWKLVLIGLLVLVSNLLGINEITSILAGGILGVLLIYLTNEKVINLKSFFPFYSTLFISTFLIQGETEISLTKIFLIFLKIGTVLFGGGYILVAYLDGEIVRQLNWISREELLNAIAIGQFTPGPILSAATFIGYQIKGIAGALAATVGVFLPSFIFVLIVNPFINKLRKSKIASSFLDAVNISALAVMLAITFKLGHEVLVDWKAILIFLLSIFIVFFYKKISVAWIVLGSAVLGYMLMVIETL